MSNNQIVPGFDDDKEDSLKLRLQKVDAKCVVVNATGYIDTCNAVYFSKKVLQIIDADFSHIVFNLAKVPYISSMGIGTFAAFRKALKPRGGDIVLLQIQPKVNEVFDLLGFAHFFNRTENLDEAISLLEGSGTGQGPTAFPTIFSCPGCEKRLRAMRAGRFRCSECKTILEVDGVGRVLIG